MAYAVVPIDEQARIAWGFLGTRNDVATTCNIYRATEEELMQYI